jgi:hypothetical protein
MTARTCPRNCSAKPSMKSRSQFNAVTFHKEAVEGRWRHDEMMFRDDLALLVVDVPDTATNRKWMKAYKARWKLRLGQLEIWMVSYPIDIE